MAEPFSKKKNLISFQTSLRSRFPPSSHTHDQEKKNKKESVLNEFFHCLNLDLKKKKLCFKLFQERKYTRQREFFLADD